MQPRSITISGKRTVYGIAFILLIFGAYAQKKRSLIVAEYRVDTLMAGNCSYLTKYNFENGKLLSKDTLFGASEFNPKSQAKTNCISFDFWPRIHQGRYVISGSDVVDLQNGSLVNDGIKELVEVMDDSLLYNAGWRAFDKKVFSFFSLKTRKFTPIPDSSFYTKGGLYSPDHRHSLQRAIYRKDPVYEKGTVRLFLDVNKIILSAIDEPGKVIVPSCQPGIISESFPQIPMIWIDNKTFLYAEYPRISSNQGTRSDIVVIRRVNIRSLKTDTIALIDSVTNGSFRIDKANNLIFWCARGDYKIDVSHKTITALPYAEFGYGFKQEYNAENRDVILYFEDKEFSRSKDYTEPRCTKGYLAMMVESYSGKEDESYLAVWSAVSGKWITIENSSIYNIVGWLEEQE